MYSALLAAETGMSLCRCDGAGGRHPDRIRVADNDPGIHRHSDYGWCWRPDCGWGCGRVRRPSVVPVVTLPQYTPGVTGLVVNPLSVMPGSGGNGSLTATGTVAGVAVLAGSGGIGTAHSTGGSAALTATTTMTVTEGTGGTALLGAATALTATATVGPGAVLGATTSVTR